MLIPSVLRRWLCVILALILLIWAQSLASVAREVWLVELNGALGPAKADFIVRSIQDAQAADAEALVIRMDTPGGLDASMRVLVKQILAADIPIVTFVAPGGSRAASAGTYIGYASHILAMAPATNIGSSTPVTIGAPASVPDLPGRQPDAPPGSEDDQNAEDEVPEVVGDAATRKIVNDAVAYLQGLAELRGRNLAWAEETVRYGVNVHARKAVELGIADYIAQDLSELLQQLDGTSVSLPSGSVQLDTADAVVVELEPDWRHDLLEIITDPTIAYGLLIFGIWGLVLEFYSPGMILPSVFGVICLLLGAYGLQMLPVNYAGLALIVFGIGFMAAEIITPSIGVLGVAGVVAFLIGSIMLMDTDVVEYQIPIAIIAGFAISAALLTALVAWFAVKARLQTVASGVNAMIGTTAHAVNDFVTDENGTHGMVWASGESWRAREEDTEQSSAIKDGDTVAITGIEGLELIVQKSQH